jgi:MYXO-CTERM domain-containing protein
MQQTVATPPAVRFSGGGLGAGCSTAAGATGASGMAWLAGLLALMLLTTRTRRLRRGHTAE